jgi:uncharacterized membrane protein YvbJ
MENCPMCGELIEDGEQCQNCGFVLSKGIKCIMSLQVWTEQARGSEK